MTSTFWRGRRVLITGHTGFKGSWLGLWLTELGAQVAGYSLSAEPDSLFMHARLDDVIESHIGDIRDSSALTDVVRRTRPEIVFHLAAQPLVIRSFNEPAYTFDVNVIGTANLLDAVRAVDSVEATIVITSDKCYRPRSDGTSLRDAPNCSSMRIEVHTFPAAPSSSAFEPGTFWAEVIARKTASFRMPFVQ